MTAVLPAWRHASLDARLGVIAGIAAVVWAVLILDPLGPATIDPDASSSVLYFQRLVSGQRLESFVPTTPKPLLTLEYGLAWFGSSDWRELVWLTIAAFGVGVGSMATSVGRLARRTVETAAFRSAIATIAAAAFVTTALLGSADVMLEVSRANSLIWALAFWAIAGLAITEAVPRPRLAGVALLLAGLCRFETFALTAVALIALVIWRSRRGATGGPVLTPGIVEQAEHFEARRRAVLSARTSLGRGALIGAALAVAALPVVLLHDWLLSGDPLYWLSVPARYTAIYNPGLTAIGPLDYAGTFVGRLTPEWPLIALVVLGMVLLARSRQWLSLAGIAAVGLGVAALLFWLAARATYISNRYYEPIDLALILAAAVGAGWILAWIVSRLEDRLQSSSLRATAGGAAALLAAVAGAALLGPALPWDRRATTELSDVRTASLHWAAAAPTLAALLPDTTAPGALTRLTLQPLLLVPSRDVSRAAVETGSTLALIGDAYARLISGGIGALQSGTVTWHDGAADRPVALFRPLEIDGTQTVDGITLERLPLDVPGTWLLRVR